MKILLVCRGNICRSPAAEAVLSSLSKGEFETRSRGTRGWHIGKAAHEMMINVAAEFGYDLRSHRAEMLMGGDLTWATHVFAMDSETRAAIIASFPSTEPTKILHYFDCGEDLIDPFGEAKAVFVACFRKIEDRAAQLYTILISQSER